MSELRRLALCVFACVAFVPAAAFAQASITGTVRDSSGGVLPGVTVEASSPALIERVRSVVSDANGQYRIVDLRPGTYAVSFTLPGFSTFRREGVELAGTFVATVNAELRVGALEETITVTAESPIVDVQRTTAQRVFTQEVIDAIPAGRSHINQIALIPGLAAVQPGRGALADVGGTNNLQNTMFTIHGSRQGDTRLQMDGLPVGNILSEGQFSNWVPDTSATQEVTVDYGAVSAEQPFGGLRINIVPREGGNSFRGTVFAMGVNSSWQNNNLTPELEARGLPDPNLMKRAYDINPSIGGPLLRDRVWFYSAARWQENQNYIAGLYQNVNAGDPTKWLYEPDLSQQGFFSLNQKSVSTRLTMQASPRNKFFVYGDTQGRIWDDSRATISPESTVAYRFPVLNMFQAGWTSPVTNRVLLEARIGRRGEAFGNQLPPEGDLYRTMIPVLEQSTGLHYRGKGGNGGASALFGYASQKIYSASATMSYVTGAHSLRFGFTNRWGENSSSSQSNDHNLYFRFNNGVPNQITMYARPTRGGSQVRSELGLFVQDQWTINRVTVNAGLRYDHFKGGYPEQSLTPVPFIPTWNLTFPSTVGNSLHDVTPRAGVSYDLFGTGRTALKVNIGKYPLALFPVGNPAGVSSVVTRQWFFPAGDQSARFNENLMPLCDLMNPLANGECGQISNLNWGSPLSVTAFNPDLRFGWGNRAWSAEFSTAIQHQVAPGVGVDVGYFRRWYGNFAVTQNRATTAGDYDTFSVTTPVDSRLPGGGGQVISGLYNVTPAMFGQVDNYQTFAKDFGKQIEYWQGVDVGVNARLQGVLLQGGVSTGRTVTDNCEIQAVLPEAGLLNPYCRQVTNFLTQVKLLGSYLVPRADIQVAATLQSSPGPQILANRVFTNAEIAPTLGRNLSGAANATINMVAPGTMYGDRANQFDVRLSRAFRFDTYRVRVNFDIANLFNASPVMQQNNAYAVWQTPQRIMDGRIFKFSGQFDF
jgi:hypothetical protein